MVSDTGGKEFDSIYRSSPSKFSETVWSSQSTSFNSGAGNSLNHVPINSTASENTSKRSRPSFLDTLNVSRVSLGHLSENNGPQESFRFSNSKFNSEDKPDSSAFGKPSMGIETTESLSMSRTSEAPKSDLSADNGERFYESKFGENSLERKHELLRPKQDEEFAALEQVPFGCHIYILSGQMSF